MREICDIISQAIMYGCLFGLAAIALAVFAVGCVECWRVVRDHVRLMSGACRVVALLAVVLATMYGGSKSRIVIDDPYIRDVGSYTTNDYVHIAVSARYDFVPSDLEILIYSREVAQTNAEDWVQLTRAEEGPFLLREFPLDIPFPNATNYDFLVAANYVPPPTVHTNGVWQIKGFVVPQNDSGRAPSSGTFAFPNTKTRKD